MKKGEIVLVPFPFSDLSGIKNRPALILFASEMDIIVAFISSRLNLNEEFNIPLEPTEFNGLKKSSYIRLNKLATLDTNLIIGKLGDLEKTELENVDYKLIELLKLRN
jgi:mRNA interferase MazF